MARLAGLEPATSCLEAMQYKTLSAASGVAYEGPRHLSRSEASTLEARGTKMAGAVSISQWMEETADVSATREVRGGVLWSGFQTGWYQPPCGPHCAGEGHSTIEGWKSRSPGKPSMYLWNLSWLQAPGRPQAVLGR